MFKWSWNLQFLVQWKLNVLTLTQIWLLMKLNYYFTTTLWPAFEVILLYITNRVKPPKKLRNLDVNYYIASISSTFPNSRSLSYLEVVRHMGRGPNLAMSAICVGMMIMIMIPTMYKRYRHPSIHHACTSKMPTWAMMGVTYLPTTSPEVRIYLPLKWSVA